MNDTQQFLSTLFAKKPPHLHILLWSLANKRSNWFQKWEDAAEFASTHNVNIYAGGGLSPRDFGPHERCKLADIAGIVGFYADIDILGPAHKTKALPPTVEDALWVLPEEFEPSILLNTGHGLQAWWLFREPLIFATPAERTKAQEVAKLWDRHLKNRAARRGWTMDSCFDFPRVFRVPGTINRKADCPDVEACILDTAEVRYDLEQFERMLGGISALKQDPEKIARTLMPLAVGEFTWNPNATINPAIFQGLWDNDMNFRLTWGAHRVDFKDQSQSSYDLALGNILYDAGVSDQETVDALVHHRRIRHQELKPNPAYYYKRTLQTIRTRKRPPQDTAELQASINALAAGILANNGEPPTLEQIEKVTALSTPAPRAEDAPEPPIEVPTEVGDALRGFNESLNLRIAGKPMRITRIVWARGTNPTWRIDLEDGQMVTLTNQSQFGTWEGMSAALTAQVNGTIAMFAKQSDWPRKMKPLFQACLIEESAGADNDIRGEIKEQLGHYLNDRGVYPPETVFGERANFFLPLVYSGNRIAIYAENLRDYLFKTQNDRREKHEITAALQAIGAKRIAIYPTRETSQSRYILPEEWKPERFQTQEAANRYGIAGYRGSTWTN